MEAKILYPSRLRLLFVPLFGLAGIGLGLFAINYTPSHYHILSHRLYHGLGWLTLLCSSVWVVAGIINFFPHACYLKLEDEGLTASWLFLALSLKWENAKIFRTFEYPTKPFGISFKWVVVDVFSVAEIKYSHRLYMGLIGYLNGPEAYAAYMRANFGADAALITNYGLSTENLTDLLNNWRESKVNQPV